MGVRRLYVEKKPDYAVAAAGLKSEITGFLGITSVESVRVLIRYDVENVSDETFEAAKGLVFSEPPVDVLYEDSFLKVAGSHVFSVEYLPGQYDQRADSAEQCIKLLNEAEEPLIHSATTYVIEGDITEEELE
ncbi:MAG: phosphoribosylformylglycinamidine synthase, partial [Lachnospiraceae bacterium]|nr:phosphoribosylformylglycinamidine synthase [Lachnospiraceae bacterium]